MAKAERKLVLLLLLEARRSRASVASPRTLSSDASIRRQLIRVGCLQLEAYIYPARIGYRGGMSRIRLSRMASVCYVRNNAKDWKGARDLTVTASNALAVKTQSKRSQRYPPTLA